MGQQQVATPSRITGSRHEASQVEQEQSQDQSKSYFIPQNTGEAVVDRKAHFEYSAKAGKIG